jgi:glucuronate isomerase
MGTDPGVLQNLSKRMQKARGLDRGFEEHGSSPVTRSSLARLYSSQSQKTATNPKPSTLSATSSFTTGRYLSGIRD